MGIFNVSVNLDTNEVTLENRRRPEQGPAADTVAFLNSQDERPYQIVTGSLAATIDTSGKVTDLSSGTLATTVTVAQPEPPVKLGGPSGDIAG